MNNNELYRHKKSDAVKWVVVFVLIAVLLMGVVASLAVSLSSKEKEEESEPAVTAYANDFTGQCFSTTNVRLAMSAASTLADNNSVSKTLTATVTPADATNKLVDWSIAWSNQAKTEKVTNYVTVTPTYDGSTVATVTCLQPFGSDQITITITTRQGGYKATCIVSFRGVATSLYLTSTIAPVSNTGRGEYYDLPSKNTTTFTANLSNAWDAVSSYNLSAEILAEGSLYFCDIYGDSFGGSTYENVRFCDLNDFIDMLGLSVSVSGNVVTVTTNKVLDTYFYSHYENDEYGAGTWYYNDLVWYEDWMADYMTYPEEYVTGGQYNVAHLDSCYFILKVTDSVSGLSTSVKFWVSTGVSSVRLSDTTLSF